MEKCQRVDPFTFWNFSTLTSFTFHSFTLYQPAYLWCWEFHMEYFHQNFEGHDFTLGVMSMSLSFHWLLDSMSVMGLWKSPWTRKDHNNILPPLFFILIFIRQTKCATLLISFANIVFFYCVHLKYNWFERGSGSWRLNFSFFF